MKKCKNNLGTCPDCGSSNMGQSTYADWCNDCGWSYSYMYKPIKTQEGKG